MYNIEYNPITPKEIKREYTYREQLVMNFLDSMIANKESILNKAHNYKIQNEAIILTYKNCKNLVKFLHNLPEQSEKILPAVLESYLIQLSV
jgi:translation initiation factor 2B subunit (eIF-2B alpha/beta/delta family)